MPPDQASLVDIILACREIAAFLGDMTKEQFIADSLVQSGVIRQLEIIGEATKRLSGAFRATYRSIPWQAVAGMRDRLIHGYDDINLDTVWRAATIEVPALRLQLEPLVPKGDES